MKQLAKCEIVPGDGQIADLRFAVLNRWSYLMMLAFEAKSFLSLSETTHQVHTKSTMEEVLTQQALFRGFVLSYAKCFSSAGQGRSSLDENEVFRLKPELKPHHRRILDIRHKFAAHNDSSGLDEAVILVEERPEEFIITHMYTIATPLHEYPTYKDLIAALEEYVVGATNKHNDSLEKKYGKKIIVNEGQQKRSKRTARSRGV